MPLETGTWTINQNGTVTQLNITSVDAAGNVKGTLLAVPFIGLWNEVLQKLTFIWTVGSGPAAPEVDRVYTGFLFTDQFRMPGLKGGTVFTLAGYFAAFQTGSTSADRPIFGWYAQIGVA